MKKYNRTLLVVLLIVAVFATAIGGTFAWFTDSVESTGNVIKSGTLDMLVSYANKPGDDFVAIEDGSAPIFNYKLWEPGYTDYKMIKIENAGNLAFKYQLSINANIAQENAGGYHLADVIDVYFLDGTTAPTRESLKNEKPSGTVTSLINDASLTGKLLAGEEKTFCLVLKMQEEAGNEYQNLSVGDGFALEFQATQLAFENDTFGDDYDENATFGSDIWDGTSSEDLNIQDSIIAISSAEDLAALAKTVNGGNNLKGKTIQLTTDINLNGMEWTPIGSDHSAPFSAVFDGQGHTISNYTVNQDKNAGLFGYAISGKISNLTVKNAVVNAQDYAGAVIGRGYTHVDNCHAINVDITTTPYLKSSGAEYDGGAKAGAIIGQLLEGSGLSVKNCSASNVVVTGYRDIGGVAGMINSNSVFENNTASDVVLNYIVVSPYDNGTPNENAALLVGRTSGQSIPGNTTITPNKLITYSVSSASELLELGGKKLEGIIELTSDIDMNGAAMPTIGCAYGKKLVVNGNGHTISNATTAHTTHNGMKHHGFFYVYTEGNFTVNDLTFKDITINATQDTERNYGAGIVICYADGDSNVTLNNVDVHNCKVLNSNPTFGDEAGVFVGYQTGTLTMINCDSTGCQVQGATEEKTGAMIGMVNGTATLTNCTTDLDIAICNRVSGTLTVN